MVAFQLFCLLILNINTHIKAYRGLRHHLFVCVLYNHRCYFKIGNLNYETGTFLGLNIPLKMAASLLCEFDTGVELE